MMLIEFKTNEDKDLFLDYVQQKIEDFKDAHAEQITSGGLIISGHVVETLYNLIPKEIKHKKGVPTVIEYQGRRYILNHDNHRA